jgi:hypothetical protein
VATRFDVAGRLADGLAAVDDLQTYVTATRTRGYANPDLTLDNSQVRDWYGTEDGLDLRLLDADCAQLRTAAQGADEALRIARAQAAALAGAWRGGGGGAAVEFLNRHCTAGATVSDAVRAAADACARLRDELWSAVDRKVAATVSIDDRTQSQRPAWLAAARVVTAGTADSDDPSASVVDTQVKPFVDHDIGGEWVPAMHAAAGQVVAAYRDAVDGMGARVGVWFEVPGDLGPRYVPPPSAAPVAAAAAEVPAAVPRPAAAAPLDDTWLADPLPMAPPLPTAPSPVLAPPPEPAAPPIAVPPTEPQAFPASAPGLGSLPDSGGGGGFGGIPGRIGDLLGGLFDPPELSGGDVPPELLPDNEISDEPDEDQPAEDQPDDGEPDDGEPDDGEPDEEADDGPADDTACSADRWYPETEEPKAEAAEVAPDPVTAPGPPPVAVPPAAAEGDAAMLAPCEIAADELPQVGR